MKVGYMCIFVKLMFQSFLIKDQNVFFIYTLGNFVICYLSEQIVCVVLCC